MFLAQDCHFQKHLGKSEICPGGEHPGLAVLEPLISQHLEKLLSSSQMFCFLLCLADSSHLALISYCCRFGHYVDLCPESRNCDDQRARRVVLVRGENRRET